jgi:polysaccharide export outer membrane protein
MRIIRNNPVTNSACCGFLLFSFVCLAIPGVAQEMTATLAPTSTKIVPSKATYPYVVGEADMLRINVWKQPEISQPNIVVRPDGMITVPLVGDVKVSGTTPAQIEAMLESKLKRFVSEPRVTVTVVEIASKTVYVTGEIARPGAYPLVGPLDVLQIIAKAGGVTPYAHRKSMFVLRQVEGGKQKLPVNYIQIVRGKNAEQNINLQPGDTVVVP